MKTKSIWKVEVHHPGGVWSTTLGLASTVADAAERALATARKEAGDPKEAETMFVAAVARVGELAW